jgi:hypothetical protein
MNLAICTLNCSSSMSEIIRRGLPAASGFVTLNEIIGEINVFKYEGRLKSWWTGDSAPLMHTEAMTLY